MRTGDRLAKKCNRWLQTSSVTAPRTWISSTLMLMTLQTTRSAGSTASTPSRDIFCWIRLEMSSVNGQARGRQASSILCGVIALLSESPAYAPPGSQTVVQRQSDKAHSLKRATIRFQHQAALSCAGRAGKKLETKKERGTNPKLLLTAIIFL